MPEMIDNFFGGRRVPPSGASQPVYDPSLGEVVREVALSTADDVDAVVEAARKGFAAWSDAPPSRRVSHLAKAKTLLEARAGALAALISQEQGKSVADAQGEVARGIEALDFALGAPHLLKGEISAEAGPDIDMWSQPTALGIVAGVTPYNFPIMVGLAKSALALACGNAFIHKPSEKVPSAALALADIYKEAGIPDGVFSVVQGDRTAVEALICHPDVAAISVVGSTPVARAIYAAASAEGKRAQALGGAKNHMVVMPDADLTRVVAAIMGSAYGAAGQRCMAISVVVAVGDTGDRLVEALAPQVRALKIGRGDDPATEMGPLVTPDHLQKVEGYIEAGAAAGAVMVVDGRDLRPDLPGFFIGGTLFDHVTPDMAIYREEIFGPVLCVVRVARYEDALELVNSHPFGNGTAIFTRDGNIARHYVNHNNIGMTGVNVPIPVPLAFHGFGGWKQSLFGGFNLGGMDSVRFYTKPRTVVTRWAEASVDAAYTMPLMR